MRDWLHALPKTELHVHLDGSLRPETIKKLAKKLPAELRFPRGFDPCKEVIPPARGSLEEYLKSFDITVRLLQDAKALERVAYELCEDAASENVIYIEVRFAPLLHIELGLKPRDVVTSVLAGLQRAEEEFGIRTGLILTALKQEPTERSMEVAQLAAQFAGKGEFPFGKDIFQPAARFQFAHNVTSSRTILPGPPSRPVLQSFKGSFSFSFSS